MAEQVAGGKRLPAEVLRQVVEKTDGVPLFVEEMTKAILESGYLDKLPSGRTLGTSSPASRGQPVAHMRHTCPV